MSFSVDETKLTLCGGCGQVNQRLSLLIFVSSDIQEFYEVTLLNTQKSREQQLEEVNHMADKWEMSVSHHNSELTHSACPVEEVSLWLGLCSTASQAKKSDTHR